ncbi:MAG: beta-galactosidase [Chitinophagaceae bacterium]|nr:beta-galactosidase [Chitinophagaceae bacterium]
MRILLLVAGMLSSIAIYAQRDTVYLNTDWQFATDKSAAGFREQWFIKILNKTRIVQLPHTWNAEDENQNHYGWGWYQKKISIPSAWKSKKIVIQFGAVNHTCIVYLNGKQIASNTGDGFSKFSVDLSSGFKFGKENIITVAVNNDYGPNKVPFGSSFDWPNDGGIIRKVAIIVSEKLSAEYIYLSTELNVQNGSGKLLVKLGMQPAANRILRFGVRITEENQPSADVVFDSILEPVWNKDEGVVEILLPKVNPWHFDLPNLYRVDVTVIDNKKVTDHISAVSGFRAVKFVNGQTFLNGERVKLMGVEWTAGSNPDFGFAEPDSVIIRYCKLMKDVNAIFTRQHFQQDDLFYDFCDRNGILVQQEIPLWGPETPVTDTIRKIAMKQLERMVHNYYNHTSIFSWGVGNELRARDADMRLFIQDMLKYSRQLDPGRMSAYVSNTLTREFINNPSFVPDAAADGDYLMMNEYGGSWWDIPSGKIHFYLDSVHMSYPDKPFFISEFGLCEPNFKGGDERRIEDLIYHMGIYESKPYVEGAIYFDLTDYRTHYPGTSDNNKYRRRIHGIYDMYGNAKSSMKVLRNLSSPVEVQGVRSTGNGKMSVSVFGSVGLPQHIVKGYWLYVSDKTDNYMSAKPYALPEIKPGEKINAEVAVNYNGNVVITIVRPTGYVAIQKVFD